jgi:hypothetical protein
LPLTKSKSISQSSHQSTEPVYQTYDTPKSPSSIPAPHTPFQYTPTPTSPVPSAPTFSPPSAPPTQPLYPDLSTPPHSPYSNFSPSRSSSYVDPNLLYTSPCTTYASAPFISPPPENPEFTAHEASRVHILNMTERAKKRTPDSSPSPKKEMPHGGIRKKKRVVKIKKRKSNPFQRGTPAIKQVSNWFFHFILLTSIPSSFSLM